MSGVVTGDRISFHGGRVVLHAGDCLDVVRGLSDSSIDAVVTDPPYALVSIAKRLSSPNAKPVQHGRDGLYARASAGFMGKSWDTGERAFAVDFWAEIFRVLKPGGHAAAFSGTRTYHRLACAVEDAGFEIRDQLAWVYGSGFPKSHDVSKAIDKAAGAVREKVRLTGVRNPKATGGGRDGLAGATRPFIERAMERGYHEIDSDIPATESAQQWQGWGTALKPAWEPIVLARKPLIGSVAATVQAHGTGGINVEACRVGDTGGTASVVGVKTSSVNAYGDGLGVGVGGRVVQTGAGRWPANLLHDGQPGEAWRYFYSAKADAHDRIGSRHPTVKPVDLMQWLVRLITPPGGVVLDPFAGTGTTGEAALREGFAAVLIEREEEYRVDIARRMDLALAGPTTRRDESTRARGNVADDHGPLFGGGESA